MVNGKWETKQSMDVGKCLLPLPPSPCLLFRFSFLSCSCLKSVVRFWPPPDPFSASYWFVFRRFFFFAGRAPRWWCSPPLVPRIGRLCTHSAVHRRLSEPLVDSPFGAGLALA